MNNFTMLTTQLAGFVTEADYYSAIAAPCAGLSLLVYVGHLRRTRPPSDALVGRVIVLSMLGVRCVILGGCLALAAGLAGPLLTFVGQ